MTHFPKFFGLFLLFLAACASPQKRIEANRELFDTFPPDAQTRIAQGIIEIGDTPDMVMIAKGKPHYVSSRKADGLEMVIWRYTTTITTTNVQPVYVRGYYGRTYPTLTDVGQTQEIETLRVEFLEGQAVIIEQLEQ